MAMEIRLRLQRFAHTTTQTGAGRQRRMINGRGVAARAGRMGLSGVKPDLSCWPWVPLAEPIDAPGRPTRA